MNLYNVDVRAVKRLGDYSAALVIAAKQKFRRGSEADSLQSILCEHSRRMDETLDEEAHKGLSVILGVRVLALYLADKTDSIFLERAKGTSSPVPSIVSVSGSQQWTLHFDNIELLVTSSYTKAFEACERSTFTREVLTR